jgi:hypothetical protein
MLLKDSATYVFASVIYLSSLHLSSFLLVFIFTKQHLKEALWFATFLPHSFQFWGAFAKLWRAAVSFVVFACPIGVTHKSTATGRIVMKFDTWSCGKLPKQFRLVSSYQLNAHFLYSITIYMLHYNPRHVSSSSLLILRRTNCIITAPGIVTVCITIYMLHYNPRHVWSSTLLIFRRTNCIITAPGIVTLCITIYMLHYNPQNASSSTLLILRR